MKNELLTKLENELRSEITTDMQGTYILVCIRKILEHEQKKPEYPILTFYCNWALHIEIERIPPSLHALLSKLNQDSEVSSAALGSLFELNLFFDELKILLFQYDIDMDSLPVGFQFNLKKTMSRIYNDTPLILKGPPKHKIIWKHEEGKNSYGGGFQIEVL